MANYLTVPILVSPHILKYLKSIYGDSYRLSMRDSLGISISIFLENDFKLSKTKITDKNKEPYQIILPISMYKKHGRCLSYEDSIAVGDLIDKFFREQLYTFALIYASENGINWKESMNIFLETFNITDEDFDFESFYRDFNRHKNENFQNPIERINNILRQKQDPSFISYIRKRKSTT